MGGIQRISLTVGNGANVSGTQDASYHFDASGGFAVGLGWWDEEYNLFQLPITLNVSRWASEVWQVGGGTGLRLDFGKVNLDLLANMGAMIGGGDAGFAVEPTIKMGFLDNLLGLEVSTVAYTNNDSIDSLTTYAGAYLNLYNLGEKLFSASDSRRGELAAVAADPCPPCADDLSDALAVCVDLIGRSYEYSSLADECFEAVRCAE